MLERARIRCRRAAQVCDDVGRRARLEARQVGWCPSTRSGRFALTLPRTTEAVVRDRVKFRMGRIVYPAFSRDEATMGFGLGRGEREALVRSEPGRFLMPDPFDLRYDRVVVRLDAIDVAEMREIVLDAWRMVVPTRVAASYEDSEA